MWRQLAEVAALPQDAADADLFAPLRAAFYSAGLRAQGSGRRGLLA